MKKRVFYNVACFLFLCAVLASCELVKPMLPDDYAWKIKASSPFVSAPVPYPGATVLAVSFEGTLYCVAAATGDVLWTYDLEERVVVPPVVDADGSVYILSAKDHVVKLTVAEGKPVLAWKDEAQTRTAGTAMVLSGDYVYLANKTYNQLRCLSKATGTAVGAPLGMRLKGADPKPTYYSDFACMLPADPALGYDLLVNLSAHEFMTVKAGALVKQFSYPVNPAIEDVEYPYTSQTVSWYSVLYKGRPYFFVKDYIFQDSFDNYARMPDAFSLVGVGPNGVDLSTKISLEMDTEKLALFAGDNIQFLDEVSVVDGNKLNAYVPYFGNILRWELPSGKIVTAYKLNRDKVELNGVTKYYFGKSGAVFTWISVQTFNLYDYTRYLYKYDSEKPLALPVKCFPVANDPVLDYPLLVEGFLIVPFANSTLRGYAVDTGPLLEETRFYADFMWSSL